MADVAPDTGAFHVLMAELAAIGATAGGGVHRLAASAEDGCARDWLRAWLQAHCFDVLVDGVGNLFGIARLAGATAPLILTGSHLDSQPMGGRLDGAYGVVAACQAVLAVKVAAAAGTFDPVANLGIVAWTGEEGARFQPSLIGSSVHAGLMDVATALEIRDAEGISLGQALRSIGYAGSDVGPRAARYIELHVECGPELEALGQPIGVMTSWWGALKVKLSFLGAQSHTGPTAMSRRRDALYASALMVAAIRDLADSANRGGPERLLSSVGRLEVEPNSPNVVPGRATLFIELRSADGDLLRRHEPALRRLIDDAARRAGVDSRIDAWTLRPAGAFDPELADLAEALAIGRGHRPARLATVAAHDAIPLSHVCPSIVVVTPSIGGMCHHEAEDTRPEDLEEGLHVLTAMLSRLCQQSALRQNEPPS